MKATTIKIEGELLTEIEAVKPAEQSVSAYVREVVQKEIERERSRRSASEYRAFLRANPDEAAWLDEWERADLGTPLSRAE